MRRTFREEVAMTAPAVSADGDSSKDIGELRRLETVPMVDRLMKGDLRAAVGRWAAGLLVAGAAGCAYPGPPPPPSGPAFETYGARGQEPGWTVSIAGGRIDYVGNYGEKRINVARPDPRTSFNGHRYETLRLIVDVTHGRCNDAMSGHGYADQVMVIADGETYRGCGGERRTDWDN